jgi:hypothetical protein
MFVAANMALPADNKKVFEEIIFAELQREEAQALIEQYNKVSSYFYYTYFCSIVIYVISFLYPSHDRRDSRA